MRTNSTDNVRGAAAVLAQDAKQLNGGALPTSINGWYGALEEYSGATDSQTAQNFADEVFSIMGTGASLTTSDGQVLTLLPTTGLQPDETVTIPSLKSNAAMSTNTSATQTPLLSDPYLHPDGSAGTTEDSDWGDKASTGEQFVVVKVQGSWTGIDYAGQIGWFYNPVGKDQTAVAATSPTITPRPGMSSIPVYGAAYPEASAYPAAIPVQEDDASYTILAGQSYATTGQDLPTDYDNALTYNYSGVDDHVLVIGHQKYYQIWFNHRIAYVLASDVTLK